MRFWRAMRREECNAREPRYNIVNCIRCICFCEAVDYLMIKNIYINQIYMKILLIFIRKKHTICLNVLCNKRTNDRFPSQAEWRSCVSATNSTTEMNANKVAIRCAGGSQKGRSAAMIIGSKLCVYFSCLFVRASIRIHICLMYVCIWSGH